VAILQIHLLALQIRSHAEIFQGGYVPINGYDRVAAVEEQARMPAAAAGDIQNRAAGRHQPGEAFNPGRGGGQRQMAAEISARRRPVIAHR
jgi:hypothetical protein